MFTDHIFNLKKEQVDKLSSNTDIKKYVDDVILVHLNSLNSQYMFHQRTNKKRYLSSELTYATLFISLKGNLKMKNEGNCIIMIDDAVVKNAKSILKINILVTPHRFTTDKIILIGNSIDNRVHLLHSDIIKKYETCNILLCKKDSEIKFDERIVLDVDFEMFGRILGVLYGETRIVDTSVEVLNEMDKLGLIKAEYMLMKQFVDKETNNMLLDL